MGDFSHLIPPQLIRPLPWIASAREGNGHMEGIVFVVSTTHPSNQGTALFLQSK
ncbi:hypothetical protein KIN20_021939 [Parelaphostrongylus tenuis]|uniref:Uncharacterized protein n=1 Tax=Parelaphostrongylus tenuis TaxID=148309 RepID=A0AAD5MPJ6_PARTN|nr:hypothetical protein KIN20_021939 [Parelaphostrongylus tenuis]